MLLFLSLALFFVKINGDNLEYLIKPIHVRIQHIDVDTHSDIVIDIQTPHFSWELANEYDDYGQRIRNIEQIGYHIYVNTVTNDEIIWNSGYVRSSLSTHILYEGKPLKSDTRYKINIKYQTNQHGSEWFSAYFRTGLFSLDDWSGEWIGSESMNMNQLRTVINLKSNPIRSATAFISGVGYYHLFIEGEIIDPSRRLDVGWTTYQQRTLYTSFDLTSILNTTSGLKGIGVVLGQGWYNKQQWAIGQGPRIELSLNYGPPRVILQLNIVYVDGTNESIVTNTNWLGREGEHRFDSIYMGTTVDFRAIQSCWSCANFSNLRQWTNASILSSPVNFTAGGQFSLQIMDPIRIGPDALHVATSGQLGNVDGVAGASLTDGGILKPISQEYINGQLFDFGQNFAGWCRITSLNAAQSTIIQLRYGELRYSRSVNEMNYHGLFYENLCSIAVMDTVILNGTGNETFEPPFTYHGFRYMLVNGYDHINKSDVECYNAHSQTRLIGNFTSSNQVINQIQHNILWSQLSNSMSIPTDCAQRNERRGWMGDVGLSVDAALFNFDYINFYVNFLTMIEDNQTPDGAVSDTVPFTVGSRPADPNWGTAYLTVTWYLYEHTGDINIIQSYYQGIQSWIDCLVQHYEQTGLAKFYHIYGDWNPVNRTGNQSLISSYPFLRDVYRFVNMSELLNRTDNIVKYRQLYQKLAEEFHSIFYNESIRGYVDGSQPMNILALDLPDVVPKSLRPTVVQSLVDNLIKTGYFTGGIISVNALFPLLSREGHHDLALQLAEKTSYPSYGYMFNNNVQNATTNWEGWDTLPQGGASSLNHHMFNSIGAWFYRYLAGIHLNALQTIVIHPKMSYDYRLLTEINAEVVTIKGSIEVHWTRISQNQIDLSVNIPNNANAILSFDRLIEQGKCMKLICNNEIIWIRDEMNLLNSDLTEDESTGTMSIRIQSGEYTFTAYWQ